MHKFKYLSIFIAISSILFTTIIIVGCNNSNDDIARKERINRNIDKLETILGYWQTPPTGGSGRIYYMYLAPNMTVEEGELVAQFRSDPFSWEVDDIQDNGDIYFCTNYQKNECHYKYNHEDDKITSEEKHLVNVVDGKTQLPYYMTRSEAPEGVESWPTQENGD